MRINVVIISARPFWCTTSTMSDRGVSASRCRLSAAALHVVGCGWKRWLSSESRGGGERGHVPSLGERLDGRGAEPTCFFSPSTSCEHARPWFNFIEASLLSRRVGGPSPSSSAVLLAAFFALGARKIVLLMYISFSCSVISRRSPPGRVVRILPGGS